MSRKLGIIGTKDTVLGFKALGFDCFPVVNPQEALVIVEELLSGKKAGYAVVFLTDDIASEIKTGLDEIRREAGLLPVLIIIPSHKGSLNLETEKIRKMVEKALGTDIFKDKKI